MLPKMQLRNCSVEAITEAALCPLPGTPSALPAHGSSQEVGVQGRAETCLVHCCRHTLCRGFRVCFLCFYLSEQKS